MKLSVLMPVYNEVHTLSKIIDQIKTVNIDKELIIVDDYSTDGSREILSDKYKDQDGIKIVFHDKNMGKGAAIKTALGVCSGDVAIVQDADMEYDPAYYNKLIEPIEKKACSVVYGSRFLATRKSTSFWHYLVNKILTGMTNMLFGSNLTDMETCYKMIRTDIFRGLKIKSNHFEIEAEITAKLLKKGYKIIEIPISYRGRSYHEGKKITWKDGLITLWILFKYRFCK